MDTVNGGNAITTSTKLADLGFTDGSITVTVGGTPKTLDVTDGTKTVNDLLNTFKASGLNASYDSTQKRFFISSKTSGLENGFTISATGSATTDLGNLGLGTIDSSYTGSNVDMAIIKPADATFKYNGATMTSSTNTVTVNGLTLMLKGITATGETLNVGVDNNSQAVYDMVKDFVTKYNALLKEMNDDYDAPSSAGYDPLTDDQKASMTDDQITQWESKIKDSLLRRDGTLNSLVDSMRSNLGGTVNVNGTMYSLASFGIKTANYTENGILHIDGNKDDSLTSASTDKLMAAITDDPDTVMSVITKLAGNLYSSMTDSMSSIPNLRSAMTVYNDKEMTSQITDYKSDLADMEKKLQDMEDRYYKQFSAMEEAMSKMNSQSSSLASMLGTGNK